MSFPFTYDDSIVVPETSQIHNKSQISIFKSLISEIKLLNADITNDSDFTFKIKAPLSRIKFDVNVEIENEYSDVAISYKINLELLIKVTLIIVFLSAFFSYFSFTVFLIFSAIFTLVFYYGNVFLVNNQIKKAIIATIGTKNFDFEGSEALSIQQQLWIENPYKCSGCGTNVTIFDLECPECGLAVKSKDYKIPLDVTKFKEKKVVFHFKSKKMK